MSGAARKNSSAAVSTTSGGGRRRPRHSIADLIRIHATITEGEPAAPPAAEPEGCRCHAVVRDRLYLGHWLCRLCGRLVR